MTVLFTPCLSGRYSSSVTIVTTRSTAGCLDRWGTCRPAASSAASSAWCPVRRGASSTAWRKYRWPCVMPGDLGGRHGELGGRRDQAEAGAVVGGRRHVHGGLRAVSATCLSGADPQLPVSAVQCAVRLHDADRT